MIDSEPPTQEDPERDTDPRGLDPPPPFASQSMDRIPGAPEWANLWAERDHAERRELLDELRKVSRQNERILKNQELAEKQFASFRAETRGKLNSHDLELEHVRERVSTLEQRWDDHIADHRSSHGDVQ